MIGSLLTAAGVADLLRVPKSWGYGQSRRGGIPTVMLGRYRREVVEASVAEIEADGGASGGVGLVRQAGARRSAAGLS